MGLVALLYGAVGQAGGSGFVAIMTFAVMAEETVCSLSSTFDRGFNTA